MAGNNIASRWQELSGYGEGQTDNWSRVLSTLDNDFRRYIIHYGERSGAAGDMFDSVSRRCKSPKENFFSEACLVKGNNFEYSVTDFIYAGSGNSYSYVHPAWFGYVAVTTDKGKTALGRRDILIAWRGTITLTEWFNDARLVLRSASDIFGGNSTAGVHTGFLTLYTGLVEEFVYQMKSARDQVRDAVRRLVDQYQDEEVSITVTGFSLGAALATLNAMDIVANGYNKPTNYPSKSFKVTAFVFAGPRVGGSGLMQEFTRSSGLRLLRITNYNDRVPTLPKWPYVHLGQELKINTGLSFFLKWRLLGRSGADYLDPNSIPEIPNFYPSPMSIPTESDRSERGVLGNAVTEFASAHNMDVYLHGVAGVLIDGGFYLDRDHGLHDYKLVNKYLNRLKPEYGIPARWWEGENRNRMEQLEDGRWKVKN